MDNRSFEDIELRYDQGIARITINRPEKLNAIRVQTYREIIAALQEADDSPDCHCLVITGAGGRFTAGNDLSDLVGGEKQEVMECVQGIFTTAANLNKVLIAVVEGVAVGIGTTILLHCDIAIAADNTKFRLPFANLGVAPEGASSSLLPRAIGEKAARELLLTGRFFSAEEALGWGLLNGLFEPGKAEEKEKQYTSLLLQQPLESLVATKELMRRAKGDVAGVVADELKLFARLLESEATRKRIEAMLQ